MERYASQMSVELLGQISGWSAMVTLVWRSDELRLVINSPQADRAEIAIYCTREDYGISVGKHYFISLYEMYDNAFDAVQSIPSFLSTFMGGRIVQTAYYRHNKQMGWQQIVTTADGGQHRASRGDCDSSKYRTEVTEYIPYDRKEECSTRV